jgi:hypothetical protein
MERNQECKEADSIVDDMVERCLTDWAGLRDYLRQRRAGRPADAALETLLSEVLRHQLHHDADVHGVITYLTARPH